MQEGRVERKRADPDGAGGRQGFLSAACVLKRRGRLGQREPTPPTKEGLAGRQPSQPRIGTMIDDGRAHIYPTPVLIPRLQSVQPLDAS